MPHLTRLLAAASSSTYSPFRRAFALLFIFRRFFPAAGVTDDTMTADKRNAETVEQKAAQQRGEETVHTVAYA